MDYEIGQKIKGRDQVEAALKAGCEIALGGDCRHKRKLVNGVVERSFGNNMPLTDFVKNLTPSFSYTITDKPDKPKFKVGDRVRVGPNDINCQEGEGEIVGFGPCEQVHLRIEGSSIIWYLSAKYLTLIKPPDKHGFKYRVGDVVRVVEDEVKRFKPGDVVQISEQVWGNSYPGINFYRCKLNGVTDAKSYIMREKELEPIDIPETNEISIQIPSNLTKEKKMEAPKTQAEKKAVAAGVDLVVKERLDAKAREAVGETRKWVELEQRAVTYRTEADELAKVLGLTADKKKQLL